MFLLLLVAERLIIFIGVYELVCGAKYDLVDINTTTYQ